MEKKEEMERKDGNGEREDGKLGGVWGWDWEWGKGGGGNSSDSSTAICKSRKLLV